MRKTIIAIACCIALLLLGYTGYRGYKVWKQSHLISLAKGFAAKSDIRNELLSLQQVLRVNPRNIEACRLMAGLTESVRSPGALIWRQRILELNPKSTEDRLALVQAAMLFKDFALATNTLAGLDEAGKKSPNYHNIAGVVAISSGNSEEAVKHFREAARLEPGNLTPQLNLAIVQLHGSNSLDLAGARIDLKRISLNATNAATRVQATRELIMDAIRFKDTSTALTLSKELTQPTNAAFADKLLRLDVLKETKSPDLKATIAQYQSQAAADTTKLSEMSIWLMSRTSPAATLTWLHTLPVTTQTNQPAALLIAECQMQVKDWAGMQKALEKQNWAELEFVRHALMARTMREQKMDATSIAEWQVALNSAISQKSTLVSLFKLAAKWNWNSEGEEILWTIFNRYPEESWAGQALQQALFMEGRTRPLMQFFAVQAKRAPSDMEVKNNLALTAMLLGAQELDPYRMAGEVYEKDPKNPSYASTYAFSLYLQKQYAQALKVMQQLTPHDLNNPSVAGYYGLILKATGDSAKAKAYLGWSAKVQQLPEEKKMFQQAMGN